MDDHPDPVAEIAQPLDVHALLFGRTDPEDLEERLVPGRINPVMLAHLRAQQP